MPHGNKGHGLVLSTLINGTEANGKAAMTDIRNPTKVVPPPGVVIRTVSHFEDEKQQTPGNRNPGTLICVFADSPHAIRTDAGHNDMAALAAQIQALKDANG